MARLDQLAQVGIAAPDRVRNNATPPRAGRRCRPCASARRNNPDRRANGRRNRRRPTAGCERNGGSRPRSAERVQQVGKALVAALAGRNAHPQDRARAALDAGDHRRARTSAPGQRPALPAGKSKNGSSSPFSQTIGSVGRWISVRLFTLTKSFVAAPETEHLGQGRFAFENQNRARSTRPVHSGDAGAAGARDEDRARRQPVGDAARWRTGSPARRPRPPRAPKNRAGPPRPVRRRPPGAPTNTTERRHTRIRRGDR